VLRLLAIALACASLGAGNVAKVDFSVSVLDPILLTYDTERRGDTVLVRMTARSVDVDTKRSVALVGAGGRLLVMRDGAMSLDTDARLALWLPASGEAWAVR
jgi:hypothetical protein